MWPDSRMRDHIWPLIESQFGAPFFLKTLLSAERSPLSDGSGSTERRLEDQHKWPKMRQICGPWTGSHVGPEPAFKLVILGFFLASLILLETPIFIVFLYKFQFKMLKCWAQIGQNFRPSKTNLNKGRAVLWSLNRRSKWDLEIKQKQKKRNTKKMWTTQNQTLLSAERSLFGQKKLKMFF